MRVLPVSFVATVSLCGLLSSSAARADEPFLRGPHPFLKDNELSLTGGYAVANGFHGVHAALTYGYQAAGSLWFDVRVDWVDAAGGAPARLTPSCTSCAGVDTFADVMAGLEYRLRTDIPVVPYGAVLAGPAYLFNHNASGAIGVGLRGAIGARYFLYDWLGFGAEIGALLGGAAVDKSSGLSSNLALLDFGVGAEAQF